MGRTLRSAQAAFRFDGTLLEIDPDTFVADHEAHAGAARADDAEPLFLAPDNARPATPRHVHNWLARIGRETGRFDADSGWNRYSTPPWATFHQVAAAALITR